MSRSSSSDIVVQVAALELDRAADDAAVLAQVAHDAERDRGLAAAALADEAHRLAGLDDAGKVHDGGDFPQPGEEADREVLDLEDRAVIVPFGHRSSPWRRGRGAAPGPPRYLGHNESGAASAQSFRLSSRRPSARRLRPRTRLISASAGTMAGCGAMVRSLRPALIVDPQSGLSGERPRPKKPERAEQDRGVADPQAEIDDERAAGVGQDFPQHDVPGSLAPCLGGRDIVARLDVEGDAADDPEDRGRVHEDHRDEDDQDVAGHVDEVDGVRQDRDLGADLAHEREIEVAADHRDDGQNLCPEDRLHVDSAN